MSPEADAAAAFLRGRSLELEGRLADAAEAYEEAAKSDPDSAELQRFLAHVYARMGDAEKAVESGQKALELEPDDERTLLSMARLYGALQRHALPALAAARSFGARTWNTTMIDIMKPVAITNEKPLR